MQQAAGGLCIRSRMWERLEPESLRPDANGSAFAVWERALLRLLVKPVTSPLSEPKLKLYARLMAVPADVEALISFGPRTSASKVSSVVLACLPSSSRKSTSRIHSLIARPPGQRFELRVFFFADLRANGFPAEYRLPGARAQGKHEDFRCDRAGVLRIAVGGRNRRPPAIPPITLSARKILLDSGPRRRSICCDAIYGD
jgi:hypothetical protein